MSEQKKKLDYVQSKLDLDLDELKRHHESLKQKYNTKSNLIVYLESGIKEKDSSSIMSNINSKYYLMQHFSLLWDLENKQT